MKEVIIDHFGRERLRALFVVQIQMCQTSLVVIQCTCDFTIDQKAPTKF